MNDTDSGLIRTQKDRNHPYKTMNTAPYQDKRLSFEARGVLAYLMSKPDDWVVRPNDLRHQVPEGHKPIGRDRIQRILKELETYGYLVREQVRLPGGRFDWKSTVYETPRPLPENPVVVEKKPRRRRSSHQNAETTSAVFAVNGSTGDGSTVNGKHGTISNMELPINGTTEESGSADRTPRDPHRDLVFEALATAWKIDWNVCTKAQREQLNQSAGILRRAGAKKNQTEAQIADAITYVAGYIREHVWPFDGSNGATPRPPAPADIRAHWGAAMEARAAKANGTPAGNFGPLEKLRREREEVERERAMLQQQGGTQ